MVFHLAGPTAAMPTDMLLAPLAAAITAEPPAPTSPPVIHGAAALALQGRQDYYTYTGLDNACLNYNAILSCDNGYVNCFLSSGLVTATDVAAYTDAYKPCYCSYGLDYINCYFNALSSQNCFSYYGITDPGGFATSWFGDFCGSIPPSIFAKLPVPTVVSLSFAPVSIITPTAPPPPPIPHTEPPLYKGNGALLQAGDCASTSFTLVDVGTTVYLAGFVGCVSDRPECCPWTVAGLNAAATATVDTTITVTATVVGGGPGPVADNVAFPIAADSKQQVLGKCPDDYYTVNGGGGCCPSQYWPFTRAIGGLTPCWSSVPATNRVATPPTLTAGLAGQPTDTTKPTSAVVNIVWAMQYSVGSGGSGSGLSTGAIVGIAVGAALAVLAICVLAFFLWRANKKKKEAEKDKEEREKSVVGAPGQQQSPMMSMYNHNAAPGQAPPPQVPGAMPAPLAMQHSGGPVSSLSSAPPGVWPSPQQQHHQQYDPTLSHRTSLLSASGAATPSYLSQMPTGGSGPSELSSQGSVQPLIHNNSNNSNNGGGGGGGYFPNQGPIAEMPNESRPPPGELPGAPVHMQMQGPPQGQPQGGYYYQGQTPPPPQQQHYAQPQQQPFPQYHQGQYQQQQQQYPQYGSPQQMPASAYGQYGFPPAAQPTGQPVVYQQQQQPPQEMPAVGTPVISRKEVPTSSGGGPPPSGPSPSA